MTLMHKYTQILQWTLVIAYHITHLIEVFEKKICSVGMELAQLGECALEMNLRSYIISMGLKE